MPLSALAGDEIFIFGGLERQRRIFKHSHRLYAHRQAIPRYPYRYILPPTQRFYLGGILGHRQADRLAAGLFQGLYAF